MKRRVEILDLIKVGTCFLICSDTFMFIIGGTSISPSSPSVAENDSLVLTCTYSGTEHVEGYMWERVKNGTVSAISLISNQNTCSPFDAVPIAQNYNVSCPDNKLSVFTIKVVSLSYSGNVFRCTPVVNGQSQQSATATIIVTVAITSVTMTSYIVQHTVSENDTLALQCVTSGGLPGATVRWYRTLNGGSTCDTSDEITATIYVTTTTVGGLNITSSTLQYTTHRNDNGVGICCSASNILGEEHRSRITRLNIQYPPPNRPVIAGFNSNSDFFMVENTLANLTCSVTGGNPLANLTWSCYGKTGNSQTISDQTVSRAVVWTASRGDERQCRCTSTHANGQTQNVVVNVKVLYSPSPPIFTVQSKQVQVVHLAEGDPLTVNCSSSSVPPPDMYIWILPDGTTLPGQLLQIDMITYQFNLVYTCIAKNHMTISQGEMVVGMRSAPLSVVLSYAPRHACSNQSVEEVMVTPGNRTVLTITVAAYPVPYLHVWTRCKSGVCSNVYNDTNTVTSTVGLTSSLMMKSTKPEDFGQYMLTVSNGIGLPYNYTFFLLETVSVGTDLDSTNTNAALISGVVGGVVALAVIIAATVVIIVCLTRRKTRGGRNETLNKNLNEKVHYDDVKELTPTAQSHPVRNVGAGISTAEPTSQSEYIGLSQYGNVQNPYEELGTGIESQTRTDKTYTNIIS